MATDIQLHKQQAQELSNKLYKNQVQKNYRQAAFC